jgi:tetratricopeptide (TPR) repeat protein
MNVDQEDSLAEFVERLRQLRARAGNPSLAVLDRLTEAAGARLAKATMHEKLRADSPPDGAFVSAFVHACVTHARSRGLVLRPEDDDMQRWRVMHEAVLRKLAEQRPARRRARAAEQILSDTAPVVPVGASPHQLPASTGRLIGRQAELHQLDRILLGEGPSSAAVAAISGPPGVGKTALAVHWARTASDQFPDGELYIDLHGYDPERPVSPHDALARLLRGLGMPSEVLSPDTDERAGQFRTALAHRRMLVVIDNARDAEHVRVLLPGSSVSRTLVTSRERLTGLVARDGARAVEVGPLAPEHSVRLLQTVIGDRAVVDQPSTAGLAAACAGLPLALRVAAELVGRRADSGLRALAAELSDVDSRLDLLQVDEDRRSAVREVLSWSYRYLDASAARLFRLFGANPCAELTAEAVAALAGTAGETTRHDLATLLNASLIDRPYGDRYKMHDLLKAYAGELAAAPQHRADSRRAVERLGEFYLGLAGTKAVVAAELTGLVSMAEYAAGHAMPTIAMRLSQAFAVPLFVNAHYDSAAAIHRYALKSARALGDLRGEANANQHLGAIHRRWGRYEESQRYASRALRLYELCGDLSGEGLAHKSLGLLAQRQGHYDRAEIHHLRALDLARRLGDRINEANTLGNLAIVYDLSGRYRPAAQQFERALAVFRDLGDLVGVGRTLDNLGIIYEREGRHEEALALHEQALAILREAATRPGRARRWTTSPRCTGGSVTWTGRWRSCSDRWRSGSDARTGRARVSTCSAWGPSMSCPIGWRRPGPATRRRWGSPTN